MKQKNHIMKIQFFTHLLGLLMLTLSLSTKAQVTFTTTKSMTNVTCPGGNDGTATVMVTAGGTAPYSYSWNTVPSQSSSTANGLTAGSYTMYVTDATGNTGSWTLSITEPAPVKLRKVYSDVTCFGANDGTATITVISGGTPPYTYTWQTTPPQIGQMATGLAPGKPKVVTVDANGCTAKWTFKIAEPDAITTSTSTTNVTCFGAANGSAVVNVFGGNKPYSYSWNSGETTNAISGKGPGTYTLTITDANGCIKTKSVVITEPKIIATSTQITQITCKGTSTGGAVVNVTGGTKPYSYTWNSSPAQYSNVLTNVATGTYTLNIVDANGCSKTKTVVITEPASAVAVTTVHTNILCDGSSTGTATATANGGTAPYTYTWSNGMTGNAISGLAAGTYSVSAYDALGCSSNSATFVVETSSAITITNTMDDPNCFNGNDGWICALASGGNGSLSYSWNTGATTNCLQGLSAGAYKVFVTDARGCEGLATFTLSNPDELVASATATDITCNGAANGTVTSSVVGGTGAYAYSWSNGATTAAISGLSAGTYDVMVTDANGCVANASAAVAEPTAITTTKTMEGPKCYNGNDGWICVTATGGTGALSYSWNTGATTNCLQGLTAGTYVVYVTDANACQGHWTITLSNPAQLVASATATDITCNGAANGTATASVVGGTGAYAYSWSNGATTAAISGLSAGTYVVMVTDANGCVANASAAVAEPTAITTTKTMEGPKCYNGNDGWICVTATGGTGALSYSWNTGATTNCLQGLTAGTYVVYVTDANACQGHWTITLSNPAQLVASATATDITCNGAANGTVTASVVGGTGAYAYSWSNGATTAAISGLSAGTYDVMVTDANGCVANASAAVAEPTAITTTKTMEGPKCYNGNDGWICVTATGGTGALSYSWNTGATTNCLQGLTAGTYVVYVTDANACQGHWTITLSNPDQLVASATATDITCNGAANGTATASVVGGTGAYAYSWSNGATTAAISGLSAGTYDVMVTDANGCVANASAAVAEPTAITTTKTMEGPKCYNGNDGWICVTATGGTGALSYSWNTGATTNCLQGLTAGTYVVYVTDANACQGHWTITLSNPAQLVASATATDITCNGAANGTATASVVGGTGAYAYSWSNGATTAAISGLSAGTYDVMVTDANSCVANASAAVAEPTAITTTKTMEGPKCYNGNDGWICVTATGGTGALSYSWNTGATTNCLQGLTAGTYVVYVTDANACQGHWTITLSNPAQLVASATATDITCNGAANGTVTASVVGGTGAYAYSWSNGATTAAISGLSAGTYDVMVTDANGCVANASAAVAEPTAITTTKTMEGPKCYNGNDGWICVTATGGTGALSYSWNTGATTNCLQGLTAGTYVVYVTDANACQGHWTITLSNPAQLVASATATDITCNGAANGTATASVVGGTGAYAYSWSNGATTAAISGLSAGTYDVMVTDANGCVANASAAVAEPTAITTTKTMEGPKCYNGNDGWICVTATGGTGALSYSWNTGATTNCLQGLTAGTYVVYVTDANACQGHWTITLSNPAQLVASATATDITCNGAANGTATASVVGGTGAYAYSWSNGATTAAISGLSAGTYVVKVTDANGCVANASAAVAEPTAIVITKTMASPKCYNGNDGWICASATGGTGALSYSWNTGATTNCINYLVAGTYTVKVTDGKGCFVNLTINLTNPSQLIATISATNITCNNANNGKATVVISGGTSPYTYTWNNGVKNAGLTGLCAGTYSVNVKDAKGCTAYASVVISNPAAISVVKTILNPKCNGSTDGSICVTPSGGTGPFTYSWNTGATTSCIYGLAAGNYSVKITDSKGCNTIQNMCLSNPAPITICKNVCNVTWCNGNNGSICVTASGGTGTYTYSWSTGATTNCISCLKAGYYTVWVKDSKGCTKSMCIYVGQPSWCGGCKIAITDTEEEAIEAPIAVDQLQFEAYPNPFVVSSTVEFSSNIDANVTVDLFNIKGEFVSSLFSGNVFANEKHFASINGDELAQGVYICKMTSGEETKFIKMILQK
jgi:hypothetical protein